jgi:hypothetical protein
MNAFLDPVRFLFELLLFMLGILALLNFALAIAHILLTPLRVRRAA